MEEKKTIEAVAMVRRIRDAHYEQLKDKSVEERLAFYREKSKALRAEIGEFEKHRESTDE